LVHNSLTMRPQGMAWFTPRNSDSVTSATNDIPPVVR